ncbi:hypothetical protein BGX31_000337, partial [Mortierella sp. GBA43]
VGGLPVSELNQLEVEFLTLNNFALAISIEELQTYGDQLMKHWMCEEVANRGPDDERPSPSVPAALPAPPVQGAQDSPNDDNNNNNNADPAYDGKGRSDQDSRPSSSRSPNNYQQQQQHRDTARKEPAKESEHRSGHPRHEHRPHHSSDSRHEQHRRDHRQEPLREYKQDQHHPQQQQYSQSHSQYSQQQQQHAHKNGSSRQYRQESDYGLDSGRFHTSQQAPITPTEMTHATSRLAAPSPIH